MPIARITDSRSFHGTLLDCRPEAFAARSQHGIPPLVLGGGMALSALSIPADTFPVGQAATGKSLKPSVTGLVSDGAEFDESRFEWTYARITEAVVTERTRLC